MNVCATELGIALVVTITGDPTAVAVPTHKELEKYSYVTVPPALKEPVRLAESVTEPPTVMLEADRVVAKVGLVFVTTILAAVEVAVWVGELLSVT